MGKPASRSLPWAGSYCRAAGQEKCFPGLWAALTEPSKPADEVHPILGAVVELGDLQGEGLEVFSGKTAVLRRYDMETECYTAFVEEGLEVSVERTDIKKRIFQEEDGEELASTCASSSKAVPTISGAPVPLALKAPSFHEIPDSDVALQML